MELELPKGIKHQSDVSGSEAQRYPTPRISSDVINATEYVDEHCLCRGLALIIQNFSERSQTLDDECEKLKECLENIENKKFEIYGERVYKNLTKDELEKLCEDVSKENFSDHYCLLVVILGPGRQGLVQSGLKESIELTTIMEKFQPQNCASLALKPKLFIVQTMTPLPPRDPNQADEKGAVADFESKKIAIVRIPRESDFLTYTSDARLSQNLDINEVPLNDNGFLKCILETLEEQQMNWKKRNDAPEIQSLLIKINRKFKMKYPGLKIPTTMSSLTKRMYLQRRDV